MRRGCPGQLTDRERCACPQDAALLDAVLGADMIAAVLAVDAWCFLARYGARLVRVGAGLQRGPAVKGLTRTGDSGSVTLQQPPDGLGSRWGRGCLSWLWFTPAGTGFVSRGPRGCGNTCSLEYSGFVDVRLLAFRHNSVNDCVLTVLLASQVRDR